MVTFKSNKDNDEYFMIGAHVDLGYLIISETIQLPEDVAMEVRKIYNKIRKYEYSIKGVVDEVAIRKDSILGKYLVSHCDYDEITNEDSFIYFNQIINAMNIAIYQDNEIFNKIVPLFRSKECGSKEELAKKYDENVLDYILANDSFDAFIERCEDDYKEPETEYVVYEDGQLSKQVFSKKQKCKKKD